MKHNNSFRAFGRVENLEQIEDVCFFDLRVNDDLRFACKSRSALVKEGLEYTLSGHFEDIDGHRFFVVSKSTHTTITRG